MSSLAKIRSLFSKKYLVLSPRDVSRMDAEHVKRAEKYVTKVTQALFGYFDLDDLVARSFVALQVEDDEGKLAGVLVANVYPNVPAIPPWEWEHWLSSLYGLEQVKSLNTLWIHLLLWEPSYFFVFLQPLIHRIFQVRSYLFNIIMVLPPGAQNIEFLGNLGTRVLPKDCTNPKSCQTLYLMQRQDFTVNYKLRRAVEEDNDDLVPLIGAHSTRLEEIYGKFYVAELLTRHKDSGRQILVAEYNGVAVAVICLNETVNYKVLNEEFQLMPFNGLKKDHPDDEELTQNVLYPSSEPLPLNFEEEVLQIVEGQSYDSVDQSSEPDILMHVTSSSSEDYSLVFTSASLFIFQDDDVADKSSHGDTAEDQDVLNEFIDLLWKLPKLRTRPDYDTLSMLSGRTEVGKSKSMDVVPKLMGEPNAFSIEIAAALPEHENGLIQLFESAFDCFPERDYSVLSLPGTVRVNKLNTLYVRATPRPASTFPYELYLLHRNAVLGDMKVVAATRYHDSQIAYILSTIPNSYVIVQQYNNYLNDDTSPYIVYVMLCENQVVGIAILSEEYDVDYLLAHYDLEYCIDRKLFKSGCHGLLESLIMSPIFHNHSNYFLRELHRLTDFSILYYKHTPYDSTHSYRERPLVNVLDNLFPILPRVLPDYDLSVLKQEECDISPVITQKKSPFALYVSTLLKCSVYRYTVNTKIVIVGVSNTALAFLEALLLIQTPKMMVTFNNVTLVGNHLNNIRVAERLQDSFMVRKYFTDQRHMNLLSLRTYVNHVEGKLTKIDRKDKYIVLNENSYLAYDLLFLMCGERFLRPKKSKNVNEEPTNFFVINDLVDIHNAVIKLKRFYAKNTNEDYAIIVYGHFLEAYCALYGLLTYGIPGPHIVFIEPFPYSMAMEKRHRHNVSLFNDPDIDKAVLGEIMELGITYYPSYYFVGWEFDIENNVITMAKFESRHKMLEVECIAMFFFEKKGISPRAHMVIDDSGLVFDGRLVIDKNCRTNDPNIYGAGTLTKYSRKYYAAHMVHQYYNRREIGNRLGHQIKDMLLPPKIKKLWTPKTSWNFDMERGGSLVPRYEQPIMRYCKLPGGLHYLSVTKPGIVVPLEKALSLNNHGHFLITGNCTDLNSQGYFKLHLNQFKIVETITCLSKFPIDIRNIYRLWGKHEKLLNNLQLRFEMGVITDLFDYFKEPWAYAIYHDRFELLLNDLNSLMTSTVFNGEVSLVSELIQIYKDMKWEELPQEQKNEIAEKFSVLTYPKILEQKVLDFIYKNLDHLPMYAHPIVVKTLLAGYKKSPMFSK